MTELPPTHCSLGDLYPVFDFAREIDGIISVSQVTKQALRGDQGSPRTHMGLSI